MLFFFLLRVIASSLIAFVGYTGNLISIFMVGYLIDSQCILLIIIISAHIGGKNEK